MQLPSVIDIIFQRRSIRKFKQEPVPEEYIQLLLEAAMAAPSAMNNQCWEFVVVTDPELMAKIRMNLVFGNREAPLAIAVCGNLKKSRKKFSKSDFWVQDCSAATENILLTATALGLGSLWVGVHPVPLFSLSISHLLKLPRYVLPLNIIYIGYPDQEKQPGTKYNEKNVYWQQYGNQRNTVKDED
jgi:nitroreductase